MLYFLKFFVGARIIDRYKMMILRDLFISINNLDRQDNYPSNHHSSGLKGDTKLLESNEICGAVDFRLLERKL